VPHDEVSAYGVIDPESETEPGLFNVKKFVEKPAMQIKRHQILLSLADTS
jgi:UTP--glucose-1-phosphate uridylyltransferase